MGTKTIEVKARHPFPHIAARSADRSRAAVLCRIAENRLSHFQISIQDLLERLEFQATDAPCME